MAFAISNVQSGGETMVIAKSGRAVAFVVAFILMGWWPLSYLGPGRAGLGLGVVGVMLWVWLFLHGEPVAPRQWGPYALLIGLAPIVLGLYAMLISAFADSAAGEWAAIHIRVGVLLLIAAPMFLAGANFARGLPLRQMRWLGVGLVVVLTASLDAAPSANPILSGHAMWLTIASVLMVPFRSQFANAAIILLAGRIIFLLGEIGPAFAALIVIAAWFWLAETWRRPRVLLIGAIVLAIGMTAGWQRYEEKRENPEVANNSIAQRAAGYREVVGNVSIFGHGLAPIDIKERLGVNRPVAFGYAHNLLLDAVHTTGLLGMATCGLLVWHALKRGVFARNRQSCLAMGLLAISMFSGGIETPHGWFAMGLLLAQRPQNIRRYIRPRHLVDGGVDSNS